MTQAKHTPGPWKVRGQYVEAAKHAVVAQVNMPYEIGSDATVSVTGVMNANAALIAAAPELLTALRLVMECAGDIFSAPSGLLEMALDDGDEETRKQANAFLIARAAIAKATGGAA